MNPVSRHIECIMKSDGRPPMLPLALLLSMGAFLYKIGVHLRTAGYRKGLFPTRRLPCKVVSIGNITVGGTGKTPMSIYVASAVRRMGLRVAVLSRGYRGAAERSGGIVSDGETIWMNPGQAGDEPYLIASKLKTVPVLVGKNRYRMGKIAVDRFHIDVIVLDDGFQHVGLERDLDLLLLDDRRPFGNRHLLPRGTLRESITALSRSDACILTRTLSPASVSFDSIRAMVKPRPVFKSAHRAGIRRFISGQNPHTSSQRESSPLPAEAILTGRPVFAFSGISGNTEFHHTVRRFGCELRGYLAFPDHHFYSNDDIERIHKKAEGAGAQLLVTTEKDEVRVVHRSERFSFDVVVVGIETTFPEDSDRFHRFLESRLLPKRDRSK